MNKFKEQAMKVVFMVAACASVLAVFLICLFLFANGLPAIAKIGPVKFLLGTTWKPSNDKFGIFPMIIASIYVTGGSNPDRCSDRTVYIRVHGTLLSTKNLPAAEIRN